MTDAEVRHELVRAARRVWPNAVRASDLPFPGYWKGAAEWLVFHAPHVGDRLMTVLVGDVVHRAKQAERAGVEPEAYAVSDEVKEIWRRAGA